MPCRSPIDGSFPADCARRRPVEQPRISTEFVSAVRSGFATTVSGRPRWPTSRPAQGGATEATFGAGRHTDERAASCGQRHAQPKHHHRQGD